MSSLQTVGDVSIAMRIVGERVGGRTFLERLNLLGRQGDADLVDLGAFGEVALLALAVGSHC